MVDSCFTRRLSVFYVLHAGKMKQFDPFSTVQNKIRLNELKYHSLILYRHVSVVSSLAERGESLLRYRRPADEMIEICPRYEVRVQACNIALIRRQR